MQEALSLTCVLGPVSVRKWLPLFASQLLAPCRHFVYHCQNSQVAVERDKGKKREEMGAAKRWVKKRAKINKEAF